MSNYLVIDSDNYEAAGIQAFFFPGGEPHVKIPDFTDQSLLLFLKLRTWNDVGLAAVLIDALAEQDQLFLYTEPRTVRIFIPYFPGARQDRTDGYSPLTLQLTAAMLSRGPMVLFDPHSASTANQIHKWHEILSKQSDDNVTTLMPYNLDLTSLPEYDGVIAPDRGAADRAEDMAAALDDLDFCPVIYAEKVREFGTGDITHYKIDGLIPGNRYLVVDDICDGGATFNLLAENVPPGVQLDLWVSHGIFSRGVMNLSPRYETIYTTDSFYEPGDTSVADIYLGTELKSRKRVVTLPLNQLFDRIMES